jgi:hypothetical protein
MYSSSIPWLVIGTVVTSIVVSLTAMRYIVSYISEMAWVFANISVLKFSSLLSSLLQNFYAPSCSACWMIFPAPVRRLANHFASNLRQITLCPKQLDTGKRKCFLLPRNGSYGTDSNSGRLDWLGSSTTSNNSPTAGSSSRRYRRIWDSVL